MIGLKGLDGGALLQKKTAQKDEPGPNFPALCLPERTLKTPYYHRDPPISLTFDMPPRLSEGSWMMCV